MFSYLYVTSCWLVYDVIYWTVESSITAVSVFPYWFSSNFIGNKPETLWSDVTYTLSVDPFGPYTPVLTYLWYLNYRPSYAYFGSYLPDLYQFGNVFWYLHHANYFWWIGYLAWEDWCGHMWSHIHAYPWWFFIIWDF